MFKKVTVLFAASLLLVFFATAVATDLQKVKQMPAKLPIVTGDELLPEGDYYPSMPGLILSPGDTAGITQYDYQSNGSSGNRIVVDHTGSIHVAWMKGSNNLTVRHTYYNCKSATGWGWPGTGMQVSVATGAGYVQIGATPDDRAVIAYHRAPTGNESLFVAIDAAPCQGFFDYSFPPNRLTTSHRFIWPYMAVDRTGKIHVTATWNNSVTGGIQDVSYTRSSDDGATWSTRTTFDTVITISPIITASPVSDKVAIVYTHPTDTSTQWQNDVYYIMSNDGVNWDFRNGKVNITEYGQGGDSLFAYTDVDAIFDYNDNLQIVWNAQYVTTAGIYYSGQLFHYNNNLGTITQLAQFDSVWPGDACNFGNWNWSYAKMSIGSDIASHLYVTYTSWDTSDCAADGYANGDIYLQWSMNGGATWSPKTNLTDSHSPLCEPGDCESDHWSSLAEKIDTSIHLFYVNDRDAGGYVQTEGTITDNPMLYLHYSQLPPIQSADEGNNVPRNFALAQNYPNPFNAKTNIEFELAKASRVELTIYDVTGAKVATLLKGERPAGKTQVNWDASGVASGVYYYTLRADGSEVSRKMTLVK